MATKIADAAHKAVFICHASEDKELVAKPLADALRRRGIEVWYDEFSIKWGDSLRATIDKGVAQCRYGIVIFSPSFFAKRWTQYELDGLAGREMASGEKVILPIWHDIDQEAVAKHSPSLALRLAKPSAMGMDALAEEMVSIVGDFRAIDAIAVAPDPWDDEESVNDFTYSDNVKLWVEVRNETSTAGKFSAQIDNVVGVPKSWGEYTRPIAWEETRERGLLIPGRSKSRLFLANIARRPLCFWFYGPGANMYTERHYTIWHQNREFDGHLEFDLQVVNLTTSEAAVWHATVSQGARHELPLFSLAPREVL